MKLKIKISNNEFVTKDVNPGKINEKELYIMKKARRKYHTNEKTTVPDYNFTLHIMKGIMETRKTKDMPNGWINSDEVMYRIVRRDEPRTVQVSVPMRGKRYISGNELKAWMTKMDEKYSKWEPVPKDVITEDHTTILEILQRSDKPISLEEIKNFTQVDDFE